MYVWDLLREHCHSLLPLGGGGRSTAGLPAGVVPPQGVAWPGGTAGGGGGGGGWGACLGVEQLLLSSLDPHSLIQVCTDGTLRVLQVQAAAAPRMVLQPTGLAGLAGAVLEPGRGAGRWCARATTARCGGLT